ncbi:MAG: DUF1572 family protein [Planctomycetes bacterium]|nr:DUF1572 family protein [Planctomycetota bacterium]
MPAESSRALVDSFGGEYARYRATAEGALAQVRDDAFFATLDPTANSIAVLVKHVGGNLRSRFTDFLDSDGEKSWRDRDNEFVADGQERKRLMDEIWQPGWAAVEQTVATLCDADLVRSVTIRGKPLSVAEALCRSVAHTATHVGQIVLLAKHAAGPAWQTLSIARGESATYNRNPTRERRP